MGPEAMLVQAALTGVAVSRQQDEQLQESEDEDEDEDEVVIPSITEVLNAISNHQSRPPHPDLTDKETNTECVFLQPSGSQNPGWNRRTGPDAATSALVKRSQTFTPSAPINKNDYICRVRSAALLFHEQL
jgi:protein KIBRA